MRILGTRKIKVDKKQLLEKIQENKEKHVLEYAEAVIAYKAEALKQLAELTENVNDGILGVKLNLTTPIDAADNYDKIMDMFKWEVEDIVELTQQEFNEYVQDENDIAISAKFSNSFYKSKGL